MRPQTPFNSSTSKVLKNLLSNSQKKSDFIRIQCVWLRSEFGMDAETVARITTLTPGTVRKIWSNFLKNGESSLIGSTRGGRRNSHLTVDEEKSLLSPFFKKAEKDNIFIVAEIKAAFEKETGKKIAKSTIYRLLARHGWKRKSINRTSAEDSSEQKVDIHEYWVNGCSSTISPNRTGNISQQWLNDSLRRMIKEEHLT